MKSKNARYRPRREREKLFGTREVALIVGCPEWRVKNFAQPAYGLPPSQILGGGGRGSRRLYNSLDVKRVQIADALVRCGFAPDAVGAGVREVPESFLKGWRASENELLLSEDLDETARAELPLLVAQAGEWRIEKAGKVSALLTAVKAPSNRDFPPDTEGNLFVLNVVSLLHRMFWRHVGLEAEGKLQRWLLEDEELSRMYEESEE